MAQAGTDVDGTQAMVRIDPVVRPPALYRIPFSLAAAGILLIAMQAGKPVIGLVLLFTVMFTTASVAWRSFSRRHAPALALRAQADRALRVGSYGEARVLYERALGLVQRDLPTGSPEVLLNCYSLATVHSMLHDRTRADEYLQRLLRGLDDRVPASWRGQLAWLLRRVAHQHSLAGDHARAIDLCERALELVGPSPGADDTTVRSVVDDVAWIHHHAGQYATAEYMFREALSIHEQFRDAALEVAQRPVRGSSTAESPYRVPGPTAQPTSGGLDRAVAYSLLGLGWTLFERARYDEARSSFERARLVANLAGHVREIRDQPRGASLHVEILRGRAAIEVALGHYDAAHQLYEDARAIAEGGDGSTQRAALAIDLGWLARCAGRYDEADAAYAAAAAALSGGDAHGSPGIESSGTIACALHESLAELRRRQGRMRDAGKEIQRAQSLAEQCLGAEHPRVASIEAIASRIHTARSDWAEAERCARRCLTILRAGLGAEHPRCAEGWVALGELHLARAQYGAAEHAFSEALRLREAAFGAAHPELAEVLDGLIEVMRASGRERDAEAMSERRGAVAAA